MWFGYQHQKPRRCASCRVTGPAEFDLSPVSKRVVTFLRLPEEAGITSPIEFEDARILKMGAAEVFTAYVPSAKAPAFMRLLERTFGKDITTRTFDTVKKCAWA